MKMLAQRIVTVMCACTAGVLLAHTSDTYRPSASERIARAADLGELTRKDAVMLQARLRFAPDRIAADSTFAPRNGEVPVCTPCDTAFYKDVHRVYEELSEQEREELRGYSPDLRVIMNARAAQTPPGVTALPDHPLECQLTGTHCIVHYSETNATHKVPDDRYASQIAFFVDLVTISKMTRRHFRKAYAEGSPGGTGLLHVYIINSPALGSWIDASCVGGNSNIMAGYMQIYNNLRKHYGAAFVKGAMGTICHEYFHGIQSTYNAWSSLWFLEASAVWAEFTYTGSGLRLISHFSSPLSLFNDPSQPLWLETYRMYSTSALAFYLTDMFHGYQFMQTYFLNSQLESDAFVLLNTTLEEYGSQFRYEYQRFWAAMLTKRIRSIAKYMVPVKTTGKYKEYGIKGITGTVYLTGARIHELQPEAGAKGEVLVAEFEPGSVGKPEAFMVYGKRGARAAFSSAGKSYVEGFGKKHDNVFLVITDTTYTGTNMTLRSYKADVCVPYIEITDIRSQTPIFAGDTSDTTITYNLLDTYPNEPFPTQVSLTQKAPGVIDHVTGVHNLAPGTAQQLLTRFYSIPDQDKPSITFAFVYQFRVPPNEWNVAQCVAQAKTAIVVNKRPTALGARTSQLGAACLEVRP